METETRLVRAAEAAEILGVTVNGLAILRSRQRGPRWVRMGRAIRYDLNELRAFVRRHTVTPTAEANEPAA